MRKVVIIRRVRPHDSVRVDKSGTVDGIDRLRMGFNLGP
jgi:hypothetical protein